MRFTVINSFQASCHLLYSYVVERRFYGCVCTRVSVACRSFNERMAVIIKRKICSWQEFLRREAFKSGLNFIV